MSDWLRPELRRPRLRRQYRLSDDDQGGDGLDLSTHDSRGCMWFLVANFALFALFFYVVYEFLPT